MSSAIESLQKANGVLVGLGIIRQINLEKITTEMIVAVIDEFKSATEGSREDLEIKYPLDAAIAVGVLALHNDDEKHPTKWDKDRSYTRQELIDYGMVLSLMVIDGLPVRIDFKANSGIKHVAGFTSNPIRNGSKGKRQLTVELVKDYLKDMNAAVENDVLFVEHNENGMYRICGVK